MQNHFVDNECSCIYDTTYYTYTCYMTLCMGGSQGKIIWFKSCTTNHSIPDVLQLSSGVFKPYYNFTLK